MKHACVTDFYRGSWSQAFREALASVGGSDCEIHFPAGRYEFRAEEENSRFVSISNHTSNRVHSFALLLENCRNVTISGEGAQFVMLEKPLIPFAAMNCENIVLRGFSVDFAMNFYAQAKVIASDENGFEIEMESPSVCDTRDGRLYVDGELCYGQAEVDPETRGLRCGTALNMMEDYPERIPVITTGPNRARFTVRPKQCPPEGVRMVLRHGPRDTPALFFERVKNLLIENTALYAARGMGVIAQICDTITIRGMHIGIAPGSDRCFSLCADGIHTVNCYGPVTIEDCRIANQYDDGINLHGIYSIVSEKLSRNEYRVRRGHPSQAGVPLFAPGCRVRCITADTFQTLGECMIEDCSEIDAETVRIVTDGKLELLVGAALENRTWCPSSVTIRRNEFLFNNPRGILATCPGTVLIEDNLFDTPYAALHLSGDASVWFESGATEHVIFRRNKVRAGYGGNNGIPRAAVNILPHASGKIHPYYHGTVEILDNVFTEGEPPCRAVSVANLVFRRNEYPTRFGENPVESNDCGNVLVENNHPVKFS